MAGTEGGQEEQQVAAEPGADAYNAAIEAVLGPLDGPEEDEAPQESAPQETPEVAAQESEEEPAAPAEESTDAPEPSKDEEGGEKQEHSKVSKTELYKALSALERYGLEESDLLGWSEEKILAKGLKLAKIQGDTDQAFDDLKRLKESRQAAETKDTEEGEKATTTPSASSSPSVSDAVRPLAEALGMEPDESGVLAGAVERSVEALLTPHLQRLDQAMQAQGGVLGQVLFDATRRSLQERFPGLREDSVFEGVTRRTMELSQTDMHSDMGGPARLAKLMEAAYRLENPDTPSAAELERQDKIARAKDNGSPEVGKRRSQEQEPEDDLVTKKALAAIDGMTPEEIVRKYG